MPYTERNDIAFSGSKAMNQAIYGATMLGQIPENFGPQPTPIYIFNIAKREFNVPRPPNHPHMFLRACPKEQPYLLVGQLEHPFLEMVEDVNQNKIPKYVNGYREAAKMLSPMNPGLDQNFSFEDGLHQGDNLNAYGAFWSENNPPLEEELAAARKRLEQTYKAELQRMSKAKTADEAMQMANDISHAAADYFGKSFTWHQTDLAAASAGKIDCGVCGEKIQPAAKICIHCGAPTDAERQERWLEAKFAEKRGPGRPSSAA